MGKDTQGSSKKKEKNVRTKIRKAKSLEERLAKAVAIYDAQIGSKNILHACKKDGKPDGEILVDRRTLKKYN